VEGSFEDGNLFYVIFDSVHVQELPPEESYVALGSVLFAFSMVIEGLTGNDDDRLVSLYTN